MKRIIIDHKKLTPELAELLLAKYPEGYGDEDIIAFKNARGEWVEAVELQTMEALYLVKISKSLSNFLASFEDLGEEEEDTEKPVASLEDIEEEYNGSLESEFNWED
ncbi:hypothetical protein [Robiginitalea marina]|uniref:DNA primase n=1 Tax=Robiginitalea marina TaxID=2954105 RepID=A0ABT1AVG7_9FLAO|nr:hypothetical protein [Robiginitalea marina]MCO5723592.1 hypothetical protein [Robiginitalea marina]